MITFFSIPKPFAGHIGVIQRNAIGSWTRLGPQVKVVLMGDEPGTAQAAAELGVDHCPQIKRNSRGTPLLDSVFETIQRHTEAAYLNYINADIVLLDDFIGALQEVWRRKKRFLMIGHRTDIEQNEPIDFGPEWCERLRAAAVSTGKTQGAPYIDYFVYRRGIWGSVPPFAVGRFSWDNWLIYRARQQAIPVIDATQRVLALHQNHDYAHAGGHKKARFGPEAQRNLALAGGPKNLFTIWDSTHILTAQGLQHRGSSRSNLGGGIWSYRRSTRMGAA